MLAIALTLLRSQEDRLLACAEIPQVTAALASAEEELLDADSLLHAARDELRLKGGAVPFALVDNAMLQKLRDVHRAAALAAGTGDDRNDETCGGGQENHGLVDAAAAAAVDVTCRVLRWLKQAKPDSKADQKSDHEVRKRPRPVVVGTRVVEKSTAINTDVANDACTGARERSLSPPTRKRLLALR